MTAVDLVGAEYWATFWEWIADKAFILVVAFLAIEYIAGRWAKPHREALEEAQKLEIAQLTKDAARLSKEGEEARAVTAAADARAAEASQKAAEAQLALEKFKAPRTISPDDHNRLVAALKPFAGIEFDAATNVQDNEQIHLLLAILDILVAADWKQIDWTYSAGGITYKFGSGEGTPNIGATASYDVEIQVRQESLERLKPAAEALARALIGIGIAAHDAVGSADTVNNNNPQALHLIVGQKR
jgi:hypothetical protein